MPKHRTTDDLQDLDPRTFLPLPDLALQVLLALAEGDLHGWGIIKRIGELTEGRRVLEAETARLSGLMRHAKQLGVVGPTTRS